MIELWKELFGKTMNIYVWVFLLSIWLMMSNLELDNRNLKMKISIIYVLFYLLILFDILDIKPVFIVFVLVTFISLEFIFIDDFARKIIKRKIYYIADYVYKIIFEYKFLYFVISLFLLSNFLKTLLKNVSIILVIYKYISVFINCDVYFLFITLLSCIILFSGIIKCVNNQFETFNFTEINRKINDIQPFSSFRLERKLKEFSNILIYKEDKSFFDRQNSYNWISFEFVMYRLKRIYNECKNVKLCNNSKISYIFHKLTFICILLKKIFLLIVKLINFSFNIIFKVVICRRSIKSYLRGYSTIEMQLIRTLAVKDGYSSHVYQRKMYEFIYSWIYFDSLKNYYSYHIYSNLEQYKYYLIYLYIMVAPVRINNKKYNSILKMFGKKSIYKIDIEEFFIWVLGLSYSIIDNRIVDYYMVDVYKMNRRKLHRLINKYNK